MKHVSSKYITDYKTSNDFNKIIQIIDQYRVKYSRDLNTTSKGTRSLNNIKEELTRIIVFFYEKVNH